LLALNSRTRALAPDMSDKTQGESEGSCWITVPDFYCLSGENEKQGAVSGGPPTSSHPAPRPKNAAPPRARAGGGFFCCGGMSSSEMDAMKSANSATPHALVKTKSAARVELDTKQVDALIDLLLEDPQFGSYVTPDFIERMAYKLVVNQAVKTILKNVYSVDGKDLMGVQIVCKEAVQKKLAMPKLHIDRRPITELVAELLKDKDINLSIVPDSIEAHMYENSIILGFSIMQIFMMENQLAFYGHTMGGAINPIPKSILSNPREVAKRWKAGEAADRIRLSAEEMDIQVTKMLGGDSSGGGGFTDHLTKRPVAAAMIRLVHRLAIEFFSELKINVFGNVISFKLAKYDMEE